MIVQKLQMRWRLDVTDEELHDLHHALRMLIKHPFQPRGDELDRLTASADAIWNAHCGRVEERSKP